MFCNSLCVRNVLNSVDHHRRQTSQFNLCTVCNFSIFESMFLFLGNMMHNVVWACWHLCEPMGAGLVCMWKILKSLAVTSPQSPRAPVHFSPVMGVNVRTIARMRAMRKSRRKPPPLLVSRLSETFEEHAELYGTNEMFLSALNWGCLEWQAPFEEALFEPLRLVP